MAGKRDWKLDERSDELEWIAKSRGCSAIEAADYIASFTEAAERISEAVRLAREVGVRQAVRVAFEGIGVSLLRLTGEDDLSDHETSEDLKMMLGVAYAIAVRKMAIPRLDGVRGPIGGELANGWTAETVPAVRPIVARLLEGYLSITGEDDGELPPTVAEAVEFSCASVWLSAIFDFDAVDAAVKPLAEILFPGRPGISEYISRGVMAITAEGSVKMNSGELALFSTVHEMHLRS